MSKIINEATMEENFSNMLSLAKSYFNTNVSKGFEYHQCLILRTTLGEEKIYSFACNSVKDLITQSCATLLQGKIPTVQNIVCMWEGQNIDVPSYQLMKTLCELNPENKNAEILLSAGRDAYVTKKVVDIIG
ncbi:MAG: hypothetical protein IKJ24_04685 [Clostridia bacterium]|nr:hypothetical protein [Clostridia bacterium]